MPKKKTVLDSIVDGWFGVPEEVRRLVVAPLLEPRPPRAARPGARARAQPAADDRHSAVVDAAILGVRLDATKAQIKAAWKKKAQELHPDKGGEDETMAELTAARDRMMARAKG